MSNETKQVFIKGFKLGAFRAIIDQNLIVDKQLIFEFTSDFVRSCIYSVSKTFMKLTMTPTSELCGEIESPENFDLYVLRGDMFKKFLSVYSSDEIDIVVNLVKQKDRYKATSLQIDGEVETGNRLQTNFILSTEEMLTNTVDDFSKVISGCAPSKSMKSFTLGTDKIQEIKRLIKKLHRVNVDNTAYLTFEVDATSKKVRVSDKVFKIEFDLHQDNEEVFVSEADSLTFNILKSDFVTAGNQTFTIHVGNDDMRVLFGGNHAASIIWCLMSKVSENIGDFESSVVDSTIDGLDLEELDGLLDD